MRSLPATESHGGLRVDGAHGCAPCRQPKATEGCGLKFFGDADKSLSLLPSGVADGKISLTAQLFEGERELWSKTIFTHADEIKAVAAWLENFWEPCPDAYLGSLSFIYSHREHIGEGYYTIAEGNNTVLYVYEQLGTSNVARAQELRALLG